MRNWARRLTRLCFPSSNDLQTGWESDLLTVLWNLCEKNIKQKLFRGFSVLKGLGFVICHPSQRFDYGASSKMQRFDYCAPKMIDDRASSHWFYTQKEPGKISHLHLLLWEKNRSLNSSDLCTNLMGLFPFFSHASILLKFLQWWSE